MIPYILCYMPPYVEHFRPTTPSFQTQAGGPTTSQFSKQIDALAVTRHCCNLCGVF